jgi:MFS family permease
MLNYYIDWDSRESLHNWVETLGLMCESTFTINYIYHAYYFGGIFGSLLIARIPDLYGRKVPYAAALAAQLPFYIALVCSQNFLLTVILSFLIGVVNAGIYNGGYINLCEYVAQSLKIHVGTVLLIFDNLTVCLVCLYFKYVTRYWLWFQLIGIFFNVVGLIGILFVPESPEYLFSFYRFEECRAVL